MSNKKYIEGTRIEDLTGRKFSRLTVIELDYEKTFDYENNKTRKGWWLCRCNCGKRLSVNANALKKGNTKSCGCLKSESTIKANSKKRKTNDYCLTGEYGVGYTNKNEKFYFDLEDYKKIKDYCWRINDVGYPSSNSRENINKKILLHRLVIGAINGEIVDHINRKRNDCRKNNLRIVNSQFNAMNRSPRENVKYIGVIKKNNNTYQANIQSTVGTKKKRFFKTFKTEEEALVQRLKWEAQYFGEFAPQRHLFQQYGIEVDSCKKESTVAETLSNQN